MRLFKKDILVVKLLLLSNSVFRFNDNVK